MDNKITKQRISEFIGYELVISIAILLVALFVFEFLYGWIATQPTTGQFFKYYYDEDIYAGNHEEFYNEFIVDKTFSYDVIRFECEECMPNTNVLRHRYAIQEADFIITHFRPDEDGRNNVASYVDEFSIYALDELYEDAIKYLSGFLKDEYLSKTDSEKETLVYALHSGGSAHLLGCAVYSLAAFDSAVLRIYRRSRSIFTLEYRRT
jgi:hypothetical protein